MNDTFELSWTPERGEWREAARATVRRTRAFQLAGVLLVAGSVALFVVGSTVFAAILLVLGIGMVCYVDAGLLLGSRRLSRSKLTVRLDPAGVRVDTAVASIDRDWHTFLRWRETRRTFALVRDGGSGGGLVVLPKRALPDQGELTRLRSLLQERVGAPPVRHPVAEPVASGSPGSVRLRWIPERADWVEAYRAVSRSHRWTRPLAVAAPVMLVGAAGFLSPPASRALWLAAATTVGLFCGLVLWTRTRRRVDTMFRRFGLTGVEQHGTVDGAGIRTRAGDRRTHVDRTSIVECRALKRSFVLRLSAAGAPAFTVIPRRAVVAPATEADLGALIEPEAARTDEHREGSDRT